MDLRSSRSARATAFAVAASVCAVAAAVSGAQSFHGRFLDQPRSCGSVWHLPWQDDLNALTCAPALRNRVTLVALFLGAGVALTAAMVVSALHRGPRSSRSGLGVSAVLGVAVAVSGWLIGRHLIWSVSGA